ncbi:hypothetical protein FRC03_003581 [Tulasnella sp. 419]|nr:hypothetical protein FRC02_001408 [Tulasnella sp. 418]KAG8962964.1 hypothetical protein FRC03_003581 [Tulasnella sp. 419]
MSLKPSHRSRSEPQPLSSLKATRSAPHDSSNSPEAVASRSSRATAQDPFSLDGFFPRTKSYFELNKLEQWDCQWADPEERTEIVSQGASGGMADMSPTNSGLSIPSTPGASLSLLASGGVDEAARDIDEEDRMGILNFSSANIINPMQGSAERQIFSPTYEHDHLFHSYDNLHSSFCERRRSMTVPNFGAFYKGGNFKGPGDQGNYDVFLEGKDRRWRSLFLLPPEEEEIEEDDGRGPDKAGEDTTDGWSDYVWNKARKLWTAGVI